LVAMEVAAAIPMVITTRASVRSSPESVV
jgi:hypothetical protein